STCTSDFRTMLAGQVALVTGASRGIGRGIALQLGKAGATVYITGRAPEQQDMAVTRLLKSPSLDETASEITSYGGEGIAVYCDHSDENDIKLLFQRIANEQNKRLDILINNAYAAVTAITRSAGIKFYDTDPSIWDTVNNVGLRNHYICSVFAAKLMVPRKKGLIVTVSSSGGLRYLFGTAYGAGKAACDRLAADMAHELVEDNVISVSLWPGPVATELIKKTLLTGSGERKNKLRDIFNAAETTEFSGKCVVALASDPNCIAKTGHILTTTALAREYGIYEDDGKTQPNDPFCAGYEDFLKQINIIRAPKLKK
uniref:Dehydrogenase/reductase SDR family member 1 n=2 Tax=Parascaris univalens TaxID=6257 RepID=A0A915B8V7_PARUN